jgi:hypothetical protein
VKAVQCNHWLLSAKRFLPPLLQNFKKITPRRELFVNFLPKNVEIGAKMVNFKDFQQKIISPGSNF